MHEILEKPDVGNSGHVKHEEASTSTHFNSSGGKTPWDPTGESARTPQTVFVVPIEIHNSSCSRRGTRHKAERGLGSGGGGGGQVHRHHDPSPPLGPRTAVNTASTQQELRAPPHDRECVGSAEARGGSQWITPLP